MEDNRTEWIELFGDLLAVDPGSPIGNENKTLSYPPKCHNKLSEIS